MEKIFISEGELSTDFLVQSRLPKFNFSSAKLLKKLFNFSKKYVLTFSEKNLQQLLKSSCHQITRIPKDYLEVKELKLCKLKFRNIFQVSDLKHALL
jgi:hypothetical protein